MTIAIKICGVGSLADARCAVEAGAALLGFNFYAKSPRCVSVQTAREITGALRGRARMVGVFVNEPTPQLLLEKATAAGVEMAQLHGDESAEFLAAVRRVLPVIRALKMDAQFSAERAAGSAADRLLLDAATPLYGGSGVTVDWRAAAQLIALRPETMLAGGLTPENIAAAIAQSGAATLDVCSGVESAPGVKDHEKIKRLLAAVAAADAEKRVQGV